MEASSIFISYESSEYFKETDFLIQICQEDEDKYIILANLIMIDLVICLEVFCERAAKNYIDKFNKLDKTTCKTPEKLKLQHSLAIFKKMYEIHTHEHKKDDFISNIKKLNKAWEENQPLKLEYETKLPLGKHGEVQLSKIFKKIGFESIFDNIKITEEGYLNDEVLDINALVQNITSYRNLAIHNGVPLHSRISLDEIKDYQKNSN